MIHRENTTRFIDLLNEFKISDFDFVFDIGAGWGFESEEFGQIFSNKSIFSFECNSESLIECKNNIKSKNVRLVDKCVWDSDGEIDFYPCVNGNIGASSVFKVTQEYYDIDPLHQPKSIKVNSITLEKFIESIDMSENKGVIWMDLQGSELRALKGLGHYLENIQCIWTEAQYREIYEGVGTFEQINDFLCQNDFVLVWPSLETIQRDKKSGIWWNDFCYIKKVHFDLKNFEKKIHSQNGEDGIIEFFSNRIKKINFFVEIGAQEKESNCLFLREKGIEGTFIDNESNVDWIKREKVNRENILDILKKYSTPDHFELLSLDIDYNTYWVLKSIVESKTYDIDIICVEYNGDLGYTDSLVVDYEKDTDWDSTIYYGASLMSYVNLLERYNYDLVYCDQNGVNAFFVKKDFQIIRKDISELYRKLSVTHKKNDKKFIDSNYYDVLINYNFNNKIRLGNKHDGGYVIADLDGYDCYISAGVGDDESFSLDIINKYFSNITELYSFDFTIDNVPWNYPEKMTHIKKNINNYNDDNNTDLTFLLDKYSNIFLKMDIEGKEIDWIDAVDLNLLKNIKQIVIEIHDTDKNKFKVLQALKKLGTTHYIIHSHGNNNDGITNKIPHVLELSMIRKDLLNELKFNTTNLPSKLDFPNNINSSEIVLNYEPFFYKEEINNHNLN